MKVLLLEMRSHQKKHRPNLGLARFSTLFKNAGDTVHYHVATAKKPFPAAFTPDKVVISLTFSWDLPLLTDIVSRMRFIWPHLHGNIQIGGVATFHNEARILDFTGVRPEIGCDRNMDRVPPDPAFFAESENCYVFTTRGCGNSCIFCPVPDIESELYVIENWKDQILPDKKNIVLGDNNILKHPAEHRDELLRYLAQLAPRVSSPTRTVEFDGGLDFRQLHRPGVIEMLSKIAFSKDRFAFDSIHYEAEFDAAFNLLQPILGPRSKRGLYEKSEVYTLYNCDDLSDTPAEALYRIYKLRYHYGLLPYAMRFMPLNAMEYKEHLSPFWDEETATDIGRWVNFRPAFLPIGEFIEYMGNRIDCGQQLIDSKLRGRELFNRFGLKWFPVVERLDFSKGYQANRRLIEEQLFVRKENMARMRHVAAPKQLEPLRLGA